MTQIAHEKMEVVVHHAGDVDHALNSSVRELQTRALAQGTAGILITKHGPGRFTLELSPEVPFGYTHEKA
ncbi:hypothetical protein AHiyo8_03160 [Arthrobacter sp. Hiyo8]|uniref:hypothetical protein n=1 Tax=Arthrobacter sp. Hiyo1 TaxID=1588020 RepID=UPI000683880D|nr:hypothetical protein [Arthrobacter sp. Hiyo1]BAS12013.1 hypothetical protein AHiyo8_03160 [Arthrobacter sp. Hiyo8]GAP60628.1 hypothetical protein AHiyo1_41920 [Arthrobacter sp. Hiyo1]